jgi:hypothetical protein
MVVKKKTTKNGTKNRLEDPPLKRIFESIVLEVGAFASRSPSLAEISHLISVVLKLLGVKFSAPLEGHTKVSLGRSKE